MAKTFLSLASVAAAAAAGAAVLRGRRSEGPDPGAAHERPDAAPPSDIVAALDQARERLRAQVPSRPGDHGAASAA